MHAHAPPATSAGYGPVRLGRKKQLEILLAPVTMGTKHNVGRVLAQIRVYAELVEPATRSSRQRDRASAWATRSDIQ
jgi:hypothetical protein